MFFRDCDLPLLCKASTVSRRLERNDYKFLVRVNCALLPQLPFKPAKLFSIDRVFRNETLDATHLAEFCQIEGLVADYNLTLGNLMAVIGQFFEKLGRSQEPFLSNF